MDSISGRAVYSYRLVFILCLFHSQWLLAASQITEIQLQDVPKGSVALGFGRRIGQSPYVGVDGVSSQENEKSSDLVPIYYYEGKYFFAHGTSLGIHLLDNEKFRLDLLARYRFDRIEETDDPFFEGIEERRQSLDSGVSFVWKNNWGELSTTAVHDALDRHGGAEVDISYRYPWRISKWLITPVVSLVYQNSALTNYYYGVSTEESRPDRPEYQTTSAQFVRVALGTTYNLNKRMVLFANASYETVDDTVANSPLVDKDSLTSAYVGLAYLLGNTLDAQEFKGDKARFGEWSWRINYGYTAEKTFLKLHNGEAEKHEDIDTHLAGLTFGKLLRDGNKVDMWGKFSFNRRLENDLQDNFWEYNAYVMAMGTGYSPWTDRELFRWGFGFGFSYADKIPAVEVFKQKGEPAAHFLNYMEAQFDVPLRNFFKAKSVQNCYAGLTLVHRSGIFASSDILGNVSGGSDVLTVHLECKR
jgi:outer membrane scaffolding protein for murein synthesis (MipA/OmpV family)